METKNAPKSAEFFYCNFCDYSTSKKGDYKRHLGTLKHKWKQMETNGNQKRALGIQCEFCNKSFKSRSGLWKHEKMCIKRIEGNKDDLKNVIIEVVKDNAEKMNLLINENKELRDQIKQQNKQISDMIPKLGNNNNNNNNNHNNNNNIDINQDIEDYNLTQKKEEVKKVIVKEESEEKTKCNPEDDPRFQELQRYVKDLESEIKGLKIEKMKKSQSMFGNVNSNEMIIFISFGVLIIMVLDSFSRLGAKLSKK